MDGDVAKNVVEMLKDKYGITDATKEKIIDVLSNKYNISVEKLQKLGPIVINIGTLAPANTPWIKDAIDTVVPSLSWETSGVVNLKIYAGGVRGEDVDVVKKMRLGELQGCGCTAQGFMDAVPELAVLTLPLVFDNYGQVDCVLDGLRNEIEAAFRRHGYILTGFIHTGFFYTYTNHEQGKREHGHDHRKF